MKHKFFVLVLLLGLLGPTLVNTPAFAQNPGECEASDSSTWEYFDGAGISLQLPEADWEFLDEESLEEAADIGTEFMSDEMAVLAMFGSDQGNLFAVNSLANPTLSLLINVMPIPADEEITVDNIAALIGLDALEEFGMIISEPRIADLDSGEAYVIDVAFEEGAIDLPIRVFERFYLIEGDEVMFMVLFVTHEAEIKDLCGDIAAIADSFAFDEEVVLDAISINDADWVTHTTDNISVSAPSNWLDRNDPDFLEMAIDLAGENNEALSGLTDLMDPDMFELFLVDPFTGASLTVLSQDLGVSVPLEALMPQLEAEYANSLGADVISIEIVELPAGEAIRAQIAIEMTQIGGQTVTFEQIQYFLFEGTQMYVFGIGGPHPYFEDLEDTFEQIAQSIELSN